MFYLFFALFSALISPPPPRGADSFYFKGIGAGDAPAHRPLMEI
jgi:hypothetical protein